MDFQSTSNTGFFDSSWVSTLEQLSDAEFWQYASEQAQIIPGIFHDKEYLQCELDGVRCLLPLTALFEVVLPPHRIAYLPDIPAWMPGILAWRAEAIAVVDLAAYLSTNAAGTIEPTTAGTLLIAHHADLTIGLLVPAIGLTIHVQPEELQLQLSPQETGKYTPRCMEVAKGIYGDALVLDIPVLLTNIVKHIEMTAPHGFRG